MIRVVVVTVKWWSGLAVGGRCQQKLQRNRLRPNCPLARRPRTAFTHHVLVTASFYHATYHLPALQAGSGRPFPWKNEAFRQQCPALEAQDEKDVAAQRPQQETASGGYRRDFEAQSNRAGTQVHQEGARGRAARQLKTKIDIPLAQAGGLDNYVMNTKASLLGMEGMRLRVLVRERLEEEALVKEMTERAERAKAKDEKRLGVSLMPGDAVLAKEEAVEAIPVPAEPLNASPPPS
ncbi:hypothetical protein HWV62_41342 [Athelia sp. TMB]|nr:hypothetical protein HWV62_41342 [Athelia sp. TMB]